VKVTKNTRVVVLMGGLSSEREVSLESGAQVFAALRDLGYAVQAVDWRAEDNLATLLGEARAEVVWIALHGAFGEDGCVQGLCECLRVPYTGADPQASAVAMDKVLSKQVLVDHGLATPPWRVLRDGDDPRALARELGYPVVVKPAREGSTVGLTICEHEDALAKAVGEAARWQGHPLFERFVPGMELSVAVLDGKALGTVEIVPAGKTYDYEAKYKSDETQYFVPARVSAEAQKRLHQDSEAAYAALGVTGHARVDYRLDPDGGLWLLELNTLPGMTSHSLLPKMAAHAGIDFATLCERILLGARLHR